MITRRQFVIGSAGIGAGLLVPMTLKARRTYATVPRTDFAASMHTSSISKFASPPQIKKFTDPLPILSPIAPPSTLTIAPSSHSFHSSLGAGLTWGYGGYEYLGPTIEVTRGTPISISAVNNLGAHPLAAAIDPALHGVQATDATNPRTVVHLHGSNTEPQSDGYPESTFTPGQNYVYNFNNNQEAATLWYHDHTLGITALNVHAGLAGLYLIRDVDDPAGGNGPLNIPAGPPYEVPLVLQDRSFNPDGSLYFPSPPWQAEFNGDVATVNGVAWPNLNVDRTVYRFRIVNGSNSRFYNLKLSSKQPIIQIGTDAGFLNAPVFLSELLLAPGERADVLIDFSSSLPGDKIVLRNTAPAMYPIGGTVINGTSVPNVPLPRIMQFTVNSGAALRRRIPKRLRVNKPLIRPIATPPVRQRFLTLVEIVDSQNNPLVLLLNYIYWNEALNNLAFMERPKVDTVEQWNIINLQLVSHPVHLHLVPFQILNRQAIDAQRYAQAYTATGPRMVLEPHAAGGPTVPAGYPAPSPDPFVTGPARRPAPNEAGWKDTAVVNPSEVLRLIVPFGAQAAANLPFSNSFTGLYVWHCHMLNHEDNEMMLPFEVIP